MTAIAATLVLLVAQDDLPALLRAVSDDDIERREDATTRLSRLDLESLPALKAALAAAPDAESRVRLGVALNAVRARGLRIALRLERARVGRRERLHFTFAAGNAADVPLSIIRPVRYGCIPQRGAELTWRLILRDRDGRPLDGCRHLDVTGGHS
jgi:hypothetical protein